MKPNVTSRLGTLVRVNQRTHSNPNVENISDTALWAATFRAEETARADRLFDDPFAARLSGERGKAMAHRMGHSRFRSWGVIMRTVLIDRMIGDALRTGVDLVLNLGAGLDTRPYRMDLPSELRWIEADLPNLLDYRSGMLSAFQPRCRLETISIDLTDKKARLRMLREINASADKILVITEGVVVYLSNAQAGELADDLHAHHHIAYWIQNYVSPLAQAYFQFSCSRKLRNAPVQFAPRDWFGFFGDRGWKLEEKHTYIALAESLRRYPQHPALMRPLFWLTMRMGREPSGCAIFHR